MASIRRDAQSQSALAVCGSILFESETAGEAEIEAVLRGRNLMYSIDRHLHAH